MLIDPYKENKNHFNPFPPISANWHLQILLCLTPEDFTRQWGTPWEVKG